MYIFNISFPYITQLIVNNCFTYQDIAIPKDELTGFKHIILTGKNGSGKTTILNRIALILNLLQEGKTKEQGINNLKAMIQTNPKHTNLELWKKQQLELTDLELKQSNLLPEKILEKNDIIFSFFKAHRKVELDIVKTVTKEDEFLANLNKRNNTEDFIKLFKQYLVNKKVYEAFDFMNSKHEKINQNKLFFETLRDTLRTIFSDAQLDLEFVQESFEFYLILSDGRRITFNQLSEGFSAFLSIIMDLIMRTDLIRKNLGNYTYEPPGIVLIDEPETHLHLTMQYEILPLISRLFPNIQLIVATHSPAIISSLKNSVVYDLTSKSEVSDWILGSSFSELMIRHFGLDNEYSPIADKIIDEVKQAVIEQNVAKLKDILLRNEAYLTPSLRLEIESQIIHIKNRSTSND